MDERWRFAEERAAQDRLVMEKAGLVIKRFYGLDNQAYKDGALNAKTKELLGLVASLVLRCDDCVKYHLGRCAAAGVNDEELEETLAVGLVVGGSVTIPHLRRAFQFWEHAKTTPGEAG